MRSKLVNAVDSIANSTWLNLIFGLFFLICGINETILELEQEFSLKAHHGMFVFGIAQSFKSLSMLLKGLK